MAYYPRKTGMQLWKETVFTIYGFCLCCKREVAPSENGFCSSAGSIKNRKFLCNDCQKDWVNNGGRLCDISRFKLK